MATVTAPTLTKRQLRSLYNQYTKGKVSKFGIERDVLGITTGRGKTITRLWQDRLGVNSVNVAR